MSEFEWLTDALLISGMSPSLNPGLKPATRTIENHVILIGPTTEEPPALDHLLREPICRSTRQGNDWLRVSPEFSGVLNMHKFIDTVTTRPIRSKPLNILVVHFRRRDTGESVHFFMAHHEEMEPPGANKKLRDDDWVHDTFSAWLDDKNQSA